MTTERVGALRYDVILNTASMKKGATDARSQLKTFRDGMKANTTAVDRYNAAVKNIVSLKDQGKIDQGTALALFKQEKKVLEEQGFVRKRNGKFQKTKIKLLEEELQLEKKVNKEADLQAKISAERQKQEMRHLSNYRSRKRQSQSDIMARALQMRKVNAKTHQLVMLNLRERMSFMSRLSPGMAAGVAGNLAGALGASGQTIGAVRGAAMLGAKLAIPAAGFLALGLAMKKAVAEADKLKKTTLDLSVLLGNSDESAGKLMKRFQKMARQTPLTAMQLAEGARQLLSFGRASRFVEEDLRRLGTIAGGDVERMRLLTKAFADVTAAGKLQGQELRQFTNQGFNPLREMVEMTGKSYAKLRREMELGLISADMVADSMAAASERYAGRLEASMNTVAAQYERIKGILSEIFAEGGGPAQQVLVDVMKGAGNLISGIKETADDTVKEMRSLGKQLSDLWEDTKMLVKPEVFEEGAFKRTRENMKKILSDPFGELEDVPETGITKEQILESQKLAGYNEDIAKLVEERIELLGEEEGKYIKLRRELSGIKEIDTAIADSRAQLNKAIAHGGKRGIDDARKSLELMQEIKDLQEKQNELKERRKREIDHEKKLHAAKMKDIAEIKKQKEKDAREEFELKRKLAAQSGGPSDDFTAAGADYRFVQQRRNQMEANRILREADKKREQQDAERNEIMERMERMEEIRHQEFMKKLETVS